MKARSGHWRAFISTLLALDVEYLAQPGEGLPEKDGLAMGACGVISIAAAFDWAKKLNPNAIRNPTISQGSPSPK